MASAEETRPSGAKADVLGRAMLLRSCRPSALASWCAAWAARYGQGAGSSVSCPTPLRPQKPLLHACSPLPLSGPGSTHGGATGHVVLTKEMTQTCQAYTGADTACDVASSGRVLCWRSASSAARSSARGSRLCWPAASTSEYLASCAGLSPSLRSA